MSTIYDHWTINVHLIQKDRIKELNWINIQQADISIKQPLGCTYWHHREGGRHHWWHSWEWWWVWPCWCRGATTTWAPRSWSSWSYSWACVSCPLHIFSLKMLVHYLIQGSHFFGNMKFHLFSWLFPGKSNALPGQFCFESQCLCW